MNNFYQASVELDDFVFKFKALNTDLITLLESATLRLDDKEYLVSLRPTLGQSYKEACNLRDEWKDYCSKWNHLMDEDIKAIAISTTDRLEKCKDVIAKILHFILIKGGESTWI